MSTEFFNDQWRIPSNENQNKVSNYSMDFDGTNDFIDCGDFSGLISNKISISAWVKRRSSIGNYAVVAGIRNTNGGPTPYMINLQTASSKSIKFIVTQSNSTSVIVTSNTLIENDIWYHVVAVADGSNVKIYVNGVLQTDQKTYDGTIISPTQNFNIGRQVSAPAYYWDGKIDQVTVFDYALSQDQVTQLGAEGYAFNFIPNDYIDLGTTTAYDTGDLSAAIWVKITDNGTTQYIFSNSGSPAIKGFDIKARGNNEIGIQRHNTTNGAGSGWISPGFIYDTWQHLAFTYEESTGTIKTFLNGNLVATDTGTSTATLVSEKLTIGSYKGVQNFINGELSNAQVFNSKLEDSEIATIYNNGKPLADMSSFTSLQGWWKLDETATFNSNWTIPDASSNSNTGTSVGMNASNLVASNINGELIANPMITSPKPIAYYQLGDQSVSTGPTSDYLVPNNSLSGYDLKWVKNNSSYTAGDSINIPGINKALAGATSMSMTFWVYLTPAVYPNGMMFKMNAGSGAIQLRFVRYGNARGPNWMLFMSDGTNFSGPAGSTSTATRPNFYNSDFLVSPTGGSNTWWNITCTWDGSNVKVYRNGVTQSSRWGTYTGIIPSDANATAFLGANNTGSNNTGGLFMDGRLSNVAFWRNYALTQSEAQEVYNNGAPLDLNNFSGSAPAAWYKLDSSAIFNNTSTEWSVDNNAYPSVYQSSLNFDGVNDYLDANRTVASNLDFSVSAWINPTSHGTAILGTRGLASASTSNGFTMLISPSGNLRVRIFTETSNNFEVQTGSTISLNNWSHVAMTYDSSTKTLKSYLNGAQAGSIVGTDPSVASIADLDIGRASIGAGSPHDYFNAEISNAAIFNTKLTSAQVTTIYNNGTPEASISHSPVSWYKLDNTTTGVQDSAGSNNGTNNGATEYAGFVNALAGESSNMDSSNLVVSDLQQTSGYSPYALSFDGTNDFLNCGNTLGNAYSSISVSSWINFGNPNSNVREEIISKDDGSSNRSFALFKNANSNWAVYGTVGLLVNDGTTTSNATVSQADFTPSANTWYNILGTWDGTNIKLYINGVLKKTTAFSASNLDTNTVNVLIGDSSASGTYFLNGKISNTAVWDTDLSSTQVTEIFNEGRPSDLHSFSTAPVAWWQLGSNSSFNTNWTCLDEIGTNNAVSAGGMTNDDITNGPGYSANGLGTSSIDIKGDAPYSTANGLSENMDVLDRTTDVPS